MTIFDPHEIFLGTSGPRNADIAIVAESWGAEEDRQKKPLVGEAGKELRKMLIECGININDCFKTNVISASHYGIY